MIVRRLTPDDARDAIALYRELTGDLPVAGEDRFAAVLTHPGTAVFGADVEGRIRSVLTMHILPNMTYGGRPYALVENVVTAKTAQGQGLGRAVMEHAMSVAWAADVYKIMLLTGKELGARGFYEKLGFTADEKFGMTLRRAPKRRPA